MIRISIEVRHDPENRRLLVTGKSYDMGLASPREIEMVDKIREHLKGIFTDDIALRPEIKSVLIIDRSRDAS